MKPDEQRDVVLRHLQRREHIIAETRRQLTERERQSDEQQLAEVDPDVRKAVEDEFYAGQGRYRYVTSDGRTLFLTPEETAQRRRARARRREGGRGSGLPPAPRPWVRWGFDAGVIALALMLAWLITRAS